jgi:hypothetical protein
LRLIIKAWIWVIVASVGFAVMVMAYSWRERVDQEAPWASGLIVISPEASAEKSALVGAISARLRLLSSSEIAEILLFVTGDLGAGKALGAKGQVRVKLIELPLSIAGIGADELQSGRLPAAGRNEILAGAKIEPRDTLIVGGQALKVVEVLKPGVALFAESFLVPPDDANNRLFPAAVPSVFHSWLVRVSAEELRNAGVRNRLEEAFPSEKYAWVAAEDRLEPRAYYLYLSGLAIFFLGGSGAFIALFRWLAGKVASPVLSGPLLEMKARPGLVWGVHLVFFGLVTAGALLISKAPEVQVVLLGKVRQALASKSGLLGTVGQAYLSGSIARAAVATFAVNFLLGSLACVTIPSILLPGSGVLLAGVRALAWGLILAPAMRTMALVTLPHSVTTLLEGEAYILATIFGLLIPIHVVRRSLGGNLLTRFGRVLLLNLKAQFWIAVVLAVAAVYEATEVVLISR